jgi:phosphoglycolate phosphatase-like HAD superfamily hydrolase
MLKLNHFGLATHLRDGGFGEDGTDRADVVAAGVKRLHQSHDVDSGTVVVVGDTPFDVASAKAHGHRSVGVATGFHTTDQLVGAEADLVYADLSTTESVYLDLLVLAGVAVE